MEINEDEYLAHYGVLRRSGRYPYGSGQDGAATTPWGDKPTQAARNRTFLDTIDAMRKEGIAEKDIAKGFDIPIAELRAAKTIAKAQQKTDQIAMAQKLKDKGYSGGAIAERMGLPSESSVRALLAPGAQDKADALVSTAAMLKAEVDAKKFIDVGGSVEYHIGVSKERLNAAVFQLKEEGYVVEKVKVPQASTNFDTEMKVLMPPGYTQRDAFLNRNSIQQISQVSRDDGKTFDGRKKHEPVSISPDRVEIRYAEDGGTKADGVIFVRPGVEDLALNKSNYAQVRIKVGDGHFLKGMAILKDDLPTGTDLVFNTNKSDTGNKLDAMKKINTKDPDLPFESVVRPIIRDKGTDKERVVSAMNIVNEAGDWSNWSRNISSQVLSKQSPKLAKSQLDMTYEARKTRYDEIMALTNPTVKKHLLSKFADETDAAAVHLKAAALERQSWKVILPIDSLSPLQVYAPNYKDGERVALIRYPHGGKFEIPDLVVNNKNPEARRLLGNNPRDAIGIHHSVAERLSGADFDGDTVLVIPNNNDKIKTSPALERLKDFNPRTQYKAYDGMPELTPKRKQQLMGDVSNLITDMTIRGAPNSEIVRAVRHSMVVIDAEKHKLNHKQSAIDHGIRDLKAKYQGGPMSGASTLISLATSKDRVDDFKDRSQKDGGPIDRVTGERRYEFSGKTRVDKDGNRVRKQVKIDKLANTNDANTLSSGTPMEKIYATHSNKLKALANQSRLDLLRTPNLKWSPSAKLAYAPEVNSLNSKLTIALKNAPLERQAQVMAGAIIAAKKAANPGLDGDSLKKIKYQALEDTRARLGAGKEKVTITDREWEAIQAGAISANQLSKILLNTDIKRVSELATPRTAQVMTPIKLARAQAMLDSGYTRAQVADQLGVSVSTIDAATLGDGEEG